MNRNEKIKRVLEAKKMIENGFKDIESISDVAEKVKLNSCIFSGYFYSTIGCTPHEYLNLIKLKNFMI